MSTGEDSLIRRTVKNSISGTLAGVAGCLVGHPFDTLKVRLQTQPVHAPVYSGLIDCLLKTLKWEGFLGLYEGVGSPLVGQMIFRATLFTSFYQSQAIIRRVKKEKQLSTVDFYIAGGMTGFVSSFVESPIDLLKTKLQFEIIRRKSGGEALYRNVFHAAYVIVSKHGGLAMYQGILPTMLRNTPGCAAYFGTYELLKKLLNGSSGGGSEKIPSWVIFTSAAFSGSLYWCLTYPIDVVKSSMQSDVSRSTERKYSGVADCFERLYKEGGWRRFTVGFSACLMRAVPANMTMLFVVERCRIILDPYFSE